MKTTKFLILFSLFIFLFSFCIGCKSPTSSDDEEEIDLPVGGTGKPSTSWYTANKSAATFHIKDADELAGLAVLVNGTNSTNAIDFSGKTIVLDVNLELSAYGKGKTFNKGKGWIPIGNWDSSDDFPFRGTFEGGNKSISGLYVNVDYGSAGGLFGYAVHATIRDLKLIDADVNGFASVGCVAGEVDNSIISNCSASGKIISIQYTGGIVGYLGLSEMSGCNAAVKVTCTKNASYDAYNVGGLAGCASGTTITNCYATGAVSGQYLVGGLVGNVLDNSSIVNSYATGSVKADEHHAGGLVGYLDYTTISKCYATGAVSSVNNAGGLVGEVNSYCDINRSFATGNVSGGDGGSATGGLAGYVYNCEIRDCYATGSVSGNSDTGGLAGYVQDSGIYKCYATGAVSGKEDCGGIAGYVENSEVYNCAALNPSITRKKGSEGTFNTVAGYVNNTSHVDDNIAFVGITGLPETLSSESVDGINKTVTQIKKLDTYDDLGWDIGGGSTPWKMDASYPIPVLSWQDPATYPALPAYLK